MAATQVTYNSGKSLPTSRTLPDPGRSIALLVGALFLVGALLLARTISWRQGVLFLLGGLGGLALYQAHFGFTSAFRHFLTDRRGAGLRAQMLMLVVGSVLFLPLLRLGSLWGTPVSGSVAPVGTSVLVGAFVFGIGMQVADGCASGTLFHLGGGDLRGVLTLVGYLIGSVVGSAHYDWWTATPHLAPISLVKSFGTVGGVLVQVAIAGAIALLTIWLERRRHGSAAAIAPQEPFSWKRFYQGPWSLLWGGVALALINAAILAVSGKPWGVTYAFTLWGAKLAQLVGIPVQSWGYWQTAGNAAALHKSIFADVTSVMDFGVMLGALLAAALAGRFVRQVAWRFSTRTILASLLGGVAMGYGARIAFGCNIGAYFSGVVSFSVHGWVWFAAAMLGSVIGVRLRPYCALEK